MRRPWVGPAIYGQICIAVLAGMANVKQNAPVAIVPRRHSDCGGRRDRAVIDPVDDVAGGDACSRRRAFVRNTRDDQGDRPATTGWPDFISQARQLVVPIATRRRIEPQRGRHYHRQDGEQHGRRESGVGRYAIHPAVIASPAMAADGHKMTSL
jgi:hypothetical protein